MSQNEYTRSVGEWLQTQRESLGLTQDQVSRDIGVSQPALCRWEAGTSLMSSYSHAKLRAYFKLQRDIRDAELPVDQAAEAEGR